MKQTIKIFIYLVINRIKSMADKIFKGKDERKKLNSLLGFNSNKSYEQRDKKGRDRRRAFTRTQKNEIWAQQKGKCAICKKPLDPRTVEYDHGKAWANGGKTVIKNGRALCPQCHKLKTHKERLRKVDKKRNSPSSSDSLFGKDLLGTKSSRRKKSKDPFDLNL
jgi:5-methylcytosine-specific restriction endonuclease McrA